jgi:hypothetical protein
MLDADVLNMIICDTNCTVSCTVTEVQPVDDGRAIEASVTDRDSAIVEELDDNNMILSVDTSDTCVRRRGRQVYDSGASGYAPPATRDVCDSRFLKLFNNRCAV